MFSDTHFFLRKIFIVSTFVILLVISCSPATSISVTPTPTFSKFLPPTWTATVTLTPTITKTITQTIIPTLSPTVTQTLSPSLTPLPSLPPLPTISFDRLMAKFEALIATNGGCRLPCFWGISPGKTTSAELNQFVNQFPAELISAETQRYIVYYITSRTGDTSFSVMFFTSHDVIQSIDLGVDTARYYVTLPKLLNDYGMPTRILVGPPKYDNNLSMLVLYENQQFMGEYVLFPNQYDNSLYCYDPPFSPWTIITWATNKTWLNFIDQEEQSYKPLAEVSDYDIPSLHKILKNPNRALCMKIQIDKILP